MKKEKIEVPIELDAEILQYAASKKFKVRQMRWYRTLPARAAAVIFIGAVIGVLQFADKHKEAKPGRELAKTAVQQDVFDWNDFEEKMEYVAAEIADEAFYLAQL